MSNNGEQSQKITALTYNELFNLVQQLREQVELTNARQIAQQAEQNASQNVTSATRSEVAEFRVIPDLNKTISQFTGRESSHEAENWLDSVNGIASANGWPIGYRLQFVRANVQGAARDWFVGRAFSDWPSFESRFRSTFIRSLNTSDRYDLLKARVQKKDEHVMDYFQPKVRLCRDLSLPFLEVRDHVLKGLYSREMALYALGRTHLTEEDLLGDLLEWARMDAIHSSEGKPRDAKPAAKKNDLKVSKPGVHAWTRFKPVEEKKTEDVPNRDTSSCCWVCKKMGHLSRDCPNKRKNTCYGCGVEGHIRPNCPERDQVSVVVVSREVGAHPYRRIGRINGREVNVLLDTGCHHVLIKASVAVSCGLSIKPVDKPLYGLGSTTVPSVRTIGMTRASVAVDEVCPGTVTMLVVSDTVQVPDVIVGRAWLDLPRVTYHKSGGRLHLYEAEPCDGETEVGVDMLGNEADYLHAVEVDTLPAKEPLSVADFGYVNPGLTDDDQRGLLELVNEYRECFAKNLSELGCTPLLTVDIHEMPNSRPVVCRPYKTTRADREEIAKIVRDWKLSGVVVDTVSPYASLVLLVKQNGKNRLCVDYRRLNKQTVRQHYPLPDMSEQLEALAAGKLFVQLDLASGYLQIPLAPEAAEKTAFITADTTGQFTL